MSLSNLVVDLWTVVAAIGVGVSLWALVDGYIDRRAQRRAAIDGGLRLIVRANLRSARASLVLHGFFLLLGVRALLVPPSTAVDLLGWGFILVAVSNVEAVGVNQWERRRMRRAAAETVLP